jgi:hypothetical protein
MPLERDASSTLLASDVQAPLSIQEVGRSMALPSVPGFSVTGVAFHSKQQAHWMIGPYALCAWERVPYANE